MVIEVLVLVVGSSSSSSSKGNKAPKPMVQTFYLHESLLVAALMKLPGMTREFVMPNIRHCEGVSTPIDFL